MLKELLEAITALIHSTHDPVPAINAESNPNGHGDVLVVKDGFKLVPLPGRMAKARIHNFHDIVSFSDWLNRHAKDKAQTVEILADEAYMTAALEPTNPSGDLVRCLLVHHPKFKAWSDAFTEEFAHREFHAFVRGNIDSFAGEPGKPTMGNLLMAELQKLQVVGTKELNLQIDERGFYHFAGGSSSTTMHGGIPARFDIEVPIFNGVNLPGTDTERTYRFEVLLSMDSDGGGVSFEVEAPSLPTVLHQARIDAVEWLRSKLDDGFLVGLGTFGLKDVEVRTPQS